MENINTIDLKTASRSKIAFRNPKAATKYRLMLVAFLILGFLSALGLLVYDNPVPITSSSFLPVVQRRLFGIIAMLLAAICQSLSTVTFQTLTNNRIITPSLLGFEAIYSTIQTLTIFFGGTRFFINADGLGMFIAQIILMVGFCMLLYGWLLTGKNANIEVMLLVGIILGSGLRSISSLIRRVLSPSDFDILQARLFASVNNADASYFPIAIPISIVVAILLYLQSNRLNVLSLGRDVSINLGINYRKGIIVNLVLVTILMAISTALIGPLTFFGFLVATFTYQITPTYDHKYLLPMSFALAFVILTAAYFFMNHIFNAQGVVSIVIEFVGGFIFLFMLFRKGKV